MATCGAGIIYDKSGKFTDCDEYDAKPATYKSTFVRNLSVWIYFGKAPLTFAIRWVLIWKLSTEYETLRNDDSGHARAVMHAGISNTVFSEVSGGENVPDIPGAYVASNFYVSGKRPMEPPLEATIKLADAILDFC